MSKINSVSILTQLWVDYHLIKSKHLQRITRLTRLPTEELTSAINNPIQIGWTQLIKKVAYQLFINIRYVLRIPQHHKITQQESKD